MAINNSAFGGKTLWARKNWSMTNTVWENLQTTDSVIEMINKLRNINIFLNLKVEREGDTLDHVALLESSLPRAATMTSDIKSWCAWQFLYALSTIWRNISIIFHLLITWKERLLYRVMIQTSFLKNIIERLKITSWHQIQKSQLWPGRFPSDMDI